MAYSDHVLNAFALAFDLHRNQMRKDSEIPYVTHLMGVAAIVGDYGGSEAQVIASLLHDAVEDQGGKDTLAIIQERFGEEVAGYVLACSDTHISPKPPWLERKKAFLTEVAKASPEVKLIVAADKLHNLRTILKDLRIVGDMVWRRFNGGRDGSLWYHAEIVRALGQGWSHPLLVELADTVDALHRAAARADGS
ncbi:MAG: bifunctional (p)ppGpp synthetase/guanosine-3',5'-bis(diphosphate) 3'-pyrophosphohydrolase [Candidatus Hydrogenedentes bacterium]|nr:bifunctional (p)ppGpp synthetase/guanosine-3',5'-bis(diphosphate) 3'-pyrophosphohydrolase [Candidatus Hydrogenedentota bacterium]